MSAEAKLGESKASTVRPSDAFRTQISDGRAVIATGGGPIHAFRFARLSGRFADVAADLAQ